MADKKAPELRFKGFLDDWEQCKLGELGSLKNGMNFSKEAMGIGYPFVNLQNLFGKNVIDSTSLGKAMASLNQLRDYSLRKGDVLFVRSSVKLEGVGEAAIVLNDLENTTYSGFVIRFRDEVGLDNDFKRFIFGTNLVRKQIISQATDSANKNISQSVLSSMEIYIPTLPEQVKIGAYLSNLDNLITLHQRKHDKLLALKKAMFERMFPKAGCDVPEIRFAGFTGAWERYEFKNSFDLLTNNTLSRAELNDEHGPAQNVHYGDILVKFGEMIDVKTDRLPYISDTANTSKAAFLQNGDVIIADTAEDATVGKCAEIMGISGTYVVSGLHTIPCRPRKRFAQGYLGYFMNSPAYHDQLLPLMQGTKVTSVSKSALQDTVLRYPPDTEEQSLIGRYFMRLDKLIALHQNKYKKLQQLKRSLLEKMFV